jgi:bla regulator protein BlaR1
METKANATTVYSLPEKPKVQEQSDIPKQDEIKEEPKFRYPANGKITSPFGKRIHPLNNTETTHYGVDIEANYGDCVISSLPGTVTDTGFDQNLGNYVKVKHNDSMETVYGHMSEILVKKDEVVDSNTRIGSAGATGAATGPHVHLEVRIDGQCVDPEIYLPKE